MGVLDEIEKMKKDQAKKTEDKDTEQQVLDVEETVPETCNKGDSPSVPAETDDISDNIVTKTVQKAMVEKAKEGAEKDMRQLVRDMTYVQGAAEVQGDEKFRSEYKKELGSQLVQDLKDEGKRAAIVEQSKKQEARNIRNAAFYSGCRPIFKLLGIEEAYGLIPMLITVVLLMIPFLVISLARFVINSINSIFTAIAGFKKPAFWICSVIIVIAITILVLLLILWVIDTYFGTSILSQAKGLIIK